MMARAKRIYILTIKVNKLFFLFLVAVFSKRNRKHELRVSQYWVTETLVKVWENSKKLWKLSPAACVPTAFLVLPNFHSCFYNTRAASCSKYHIQFSHLNQQQNSFSCFGAKAWNCLPSQVCNQPKVAVKKSIGKALFATLEGEEEYIEAPNLLSKINLYFT